MGRCGCRAYRFGLCRGGAARPALQCRRLPARRRPRAAARHRSATAETARLRPPARPQGGSAARHRRELAYRVATLLPQSAVRAAHPRAAQLEPPQARPRRDSHPVRPRTGVRHGRARDHRAVFGAAGALPPAWDAHGGCGHRHGHLGNRGGEARRARGHRRGRRRARRQGRAGQHRAQRRRRARASHRRRRLLCTGGNLRSHRVQHHQRFSDQHRAAGSAAVERGGRLHRVGHERAQLAWWGAPRDCGRGLTLEEARKRRTWVAAVFRKR
jgi:hypothetical protein